MKLVHSREINHDLFNRIARIAAGTLGAPVTLVTLRENRKLSVLGTHGLHLKNFDDSWCMGASLIRRQTMSFVANVTRDPNFRGHPLLKAAPFARSLAHIPVQAEHSDIEAAITLINPHQKWPFSATTSAILTDLSMLIGDALKAAGQQPAAVGVDQKAIQTEGLREGQDASRYLTTGKDTAGQFLVSTLNRRTSIRNRADVSFVTLRTWTKPIKEHQISALRIVKQDADNGFVECVATEMAAHVRNLYGVPQIGSVVPVPCGHSSRTACLSVRIAKRLSEVLAVPFLDALEYTPRSGSSHPSNNAALRAPKLTTKDKIDSVLLVDDVASSGRHIELAVNSLRKITDHVSAMAWIGAA